MPFRNQSKKTSLIILLFSFHYSKCSLKGKIFLSGSGLTEGLEFEDRRLEQKKRCPQVPPGEPAPEVTTAPLSSAHAPQEGPPDKAPARGCQGTGQRAGLFTHPIGMTLLDTGKVKSPFSHLNKGPELEILENLELRLKPLGAGAAPER